MMTEASSQVRSGVQFGLLITALGGFLFTFDLPLLRLAAADKWTMVFARGVLLFASITITWWLVQRVSAERRPFIAGAAGLAVVGTNTIANIAYIGSITETHAANVVFILALVPILTAIFSRIFISEQVHSVTWLAAALSFLGVGIIVWDGVHSGKLFGDFLALVCACCTAAAFTIIRASGRNVATSLGLGSLVSAAVALLFFPVDFASLLNVTSFGMPAWFWIALNGFIAIPIASTLIANGPRFLPSVDVSMFFLLETVLTPIWIWFLFNEQPSNAVLLGGALVVVTLVAHSFWRLRQSLGKAQSTSSPH
ncbi:MAG: DMT family transporter [Proteobacteria bacterium]|nr:DMT family transporter [Pseudomonadota bacterium]